MHVILFIVYHTVHSSLLNLPLGRKRVYTAIMCVLQYPTVGTLLT